MYGVKRRLLLSLAALSPGVAVVTLQEFAVSMAFVLLGLTGAISVAAAAIAMSPSMAQNKLGPSDHKKDYKSLLVPSAIAELRRTAPNPVVIKVMLNKLITPTQLQPSFATQEDQIAMVISKILARWESPDVMHLSDEQALELWLVERLMRATPAEAGALAAYFSAPNAMLTMRDSIAAPVFA